MNEYPDIPGFAYADGGVVAPLGFMASGVAAGLKSAGKRDLALVAAESAVPAAAVFTTNLVAAAPVVVSRRHIAQGRARAVIINAGNANACTGEQGVDDAITTARAVAAALACEPGEVIVSSTGVIGVPLPVDTLLAAVPEAVDSLDSRSGDAAATAIMTTDTFAKQTAVTVEVAGRRVIVGGMAKGSGMIAPNMATMLSVITTDAPLTSAACDAALRHAVGLTFNRVTVDMDTSTNDMCVLLASGEAGGDPIDVDDAEFAIVQEAVHAVAGELARMIARDGEGATKLVTVTVQGAATEGDAEQAAFSIANSPLVKTALFGNDANWGRVAAALGRSGAKVDARAFDIDFAGIAVCRAGAALGFDEDAALDALKQPEVEVRVDLHLGQGAATVWTCDLTYEYVRINGEYRS
ncbi:MAG: bifunctional glutamate N-acetyltransferase/amino-acid acetyltransferase ArgJ [Coriobacteriia bacterium]|nr:bifunctional glutamate N-acetyltransferase/amino-acid acetyltransferase ArgJ [Coriobacteriia bacterium]